MPGKRGLGLKTGRKSLPEGKRKKYLQVRVAMIGDDDTELRDALEKLTPEDRRRVLVEASRATTE